MSYFYLLKAIYKVSFGQIIKVCVKSKNISLSFSFFLDKTSFPLCIFDYFYLVCTKKLKIMQKDAKNIKMHANTHKKHTKITKSIKRCFSYLNLKLFKFYYILFLISFYLLRAVVYFFTCTLHPLVSSILMKFFLPKMHEYVKRR